MPFSTTQRESLDPGSLVKGLDEEGLPTPNWNLNAFTPAGGILSNVKDLSSFASAQFDTSNYALNLTREVTFSDTTHIEVGLGWLIINTKIGDRWHWHNGGTGGYRSSMAIDIEKKNAVIVLSNVSGLSPKAFQIDDLCFDLMKSLSDF
jgi:CubicO group peptidase (beta-lactamase class C family)